MKCNGLMGKMMSFYQNTIKIFFSILDFYPPKFDRTGMACISIDGEFPCASFMFFMLFGENRKNYEKTLKKHIKIEILATA